METTQSHFHQWSGVISFILIYSIALFFMPFYKKINKKPSLAYVAFIIAFAVEMHGIPLSMYFISWIIGKKLPEGFLWGHTLFTKIGHTGMYINVFCVIIAMILIINGWYNIYHKYWSLEKKDRLLVKNGIYKLIRHPQYSGFILLTIGMIIEWATLPMLLMWPIIVMLYYKLAKKEEKDLIEEFGEEYIMYMKKTKRFIPYIL
jgi:protein-S-isoprenylcysteine O-methyltransferase Ste14